MYPCYAFCENVNDILKYCSLNTSYENYLSLSELVEREIDKLQQLNHPYFLTFKGGVFHAMDQGAYTDEKRNHWIKTAGYKDAVENNISDIEMVVSLIIKKDPNALIVILGDHGAYIHHNRYRKEHPINIIAEDHFNVYGAVRLPPHYGKFSFDGNGIYINHSNIFVHIFSLLSQNSEYLNLQRIPVSRILQLCDKVVIENGAIKKDFSFE